MPAGARRTRRWPAAGALCLALVAGAPNLAAQMPGGGEPPPWPPLTAGAHFGYDQSSNGEVLGVQLRAALLRSGRIQLVPHANVTFLPRLREYQYGLDAVWVSGGRAGGLYLGGGAGLRNSIFTSDAQGERETRVTYAGVLGLLAGGGRVGTQVEFRWIFLRDTEFDPRMVTLGVNIPIWGRSAP